MRASTTSRTSTSTLPRDSLIVFTGLSGSGKSSLAFDTIYAEGQRRYVESLSAYARQFLGQMDKPDVDFIEGLSPAISIDQKSTSRNPRSTVGTITEIYDYLRLLYARIGQPHCPNCGRPIARQTAEQIVDQVHELPTGTRFQVLAPVVQGRKGEHAALFQQLSTDGYARVRVDGQVHPIDEVPKLAKTKKHTIEVVVDRLVQKEDIRRRLSDSIETALQLADGVAMIEVVPTREAIEEAEAAGLPVPEAEMLTFSEHLACAHCGLSLRTARAAQLLVQLALRRVRDVQRARHPADRRPGAGARRPGPGGHRGRDPALGDRRQSNYYQQLLRATVEHVGEDPDAPWKDLSPDAQDAVLHGLPDRVHVSYTNRYGRSRSYRAQVEGVIPSLLRRHAETESSHVREQVEQYMREVPCPACAGKRLKPIVLGVTVGGTSIAELTSLSVADADRFVAGLELSRPRDHHRCPGRQGDPRPADLPARRRARLPHPRPAPPGRCRAARPSASAWPRRSAPGSSGCCTSSTSRRSGCTSATTSGSSRRSSACATSATP